MSGRRGYTLIELLIAVTFAGLVLAAVMGVSVRQQQFYTRAADVSAALDAVELTEASLGAELLPLNAGAGDLLHTGADSMEIRAFRGVFTVCSLSTTDGVTATLRRVTQGGVPEVGDSLWVYSEGSSADVGDDFWEMGGVAGVTSASCPNGAAGWDVEIGGVTATEAAVVPTGSPLRLFRRAAIWLERNDRGWFFMTDARGDEAMPVSGRLAPSSVDTLNAGFRYLAADGTTASNPTDVSLILLDAEVVGAVPRTDGEEPYRRTRTLSFKLRNNS